MINHQDCVIDAEYTEYEVISSTLATTLIPAVKRNNNRCYTMVDVMNEGRMLPPATQLFKELWFENEIGILFAEQGKAKTILAVQIAEKLSENQKILYLDYEMSIRQLYNRYSEDGIEYQFNDNFIHPRYEDICFTENKVSQTINFIQKMCEINGVKVVIIDNITALTHQLESSGAMVKLMDKLNKLKIEFDLSILLIGHTKKRNKKDPIIDNDLAGSKKIIGLVDSAFALNCSYNDNKLLYIKQIKSRNCEMKYGGDNVITGVVEKFNSFLQFIETGYANESELLEKNGNGNTKIALLSQIYKQHIIGRSNREIAKKIGVSEGTVRNYLKKINEDKELEKRVNPFNNCGSEVA